MSVWERLVRRVAAVPALPAGFTGTLEPTERVVTTGELAGGGHLVLTQLGLWVPEGAEARRIGWHLVSKAVWDRSALVVTEAVSTGTAGDAVLLSDLPPRRFALVQPGKVPEVVRERVTSLIRSSQHCELPGGGAWFVQRRIPGRDGVVLQVRADPGTEPGAVKMMASEVAARLPRLAPPG
ncbi:MAG TPA: hypothetical protein VK887_00795 [Pseudonocardiaceae bacterium]|nr:hypothetical protein [Pseudonocardiaceae bacterium]